MTVELRPEITASPEDIFGPRGRWITRLTGVEKVIRVADDIEEMRPHVDARGMKLIELSRSNWVLYKEGQTLEESELTFLTDRVDGHVWIFDCEIQKFKDLFGEGAVG